MTDLRTWLRDIDPEQVLTGATVLKAEWNEFADQLSLELSTGHRVAVYGHAIDVYGTEKR